MNRGILLSGGMDSISLAYWKRPDVALTIDYGQASAESEIRSSAIISKALGMEHYIVRVDCSSLGSGDLVNRGAIEKSPSSEWWPYRNQLLVTLACMRVISLGVKELMVGSVRSDSFHSDGTFGFYERMNELMEYQEGNIQISCPCIELSTVELIRISKIPRPMLLWAHSCHTSIIACGKCRGCNKYGQTLNQLYQDK